MPVTITCQRCDKMFSVPPSLAERKFCSLKCSKNPPIQKICVICGKAFEQTPSRGKEQATCRSEECKKAIKFGKHNPFYGKQHSEETIAKISQVKRGVFTDVDCSCGCGIKVSIPAYRLKRSKTDAFFVDPSHFHEWLVGENHWNYRGGNIYYGDGWSRIAQAVRDRDKVCQECGKTPEENGRALDVHHINPARVSRDNSMENLVALCMSCHHKINVFEQYKYPHKLGKYRRCLTCDKVFVPEPFQHFCSPECHRKRVRQYEKRYLASHPEGYQRRRRYIKRWQHANPEKMRVYRSRRRSRRSGLA